MGGMRYEVASFSDKEEPDDVYEVTMSGSKPSCSCPGFKHNPSISHKHIKLVDAFIKAGEPKYMTWWLDSSGNIHNYKFA